MTNEELFQYRKQLFIDAVRQEKKPDRVPHMGNIYLWKVTDAGYKISEAVRNWDIMEKCVRHQQENYVCDSIVCIGQTVPLKMVDAWGGTYYVVDDEKGTLSIKDNPRLQPEDYDLLIEDVNRYYWEVLMPRRFPAKFNSDLTLDDFRETIAEYRKFTDYIGHIKQIMKDEYAIPTPQHCIPCKSSAMDDLMNWLRGIRGLSHDMRKMPEKMKEVVTAMDARGLDPWCESIKTAPKDPDTAFDVRTAVMAHNLLSPKQFEDYYWPSLKKILDATVEGGKLAYLYIQGSFKRFWDYLKDYPKGHFAIYTELDDVYEMRRALPNITAAGGIPVSMLGNASKEACVAYVRRLVEELGADGGFILSEDKMVSFPHDARPENLRAVCDFIQTYNS